MGDYIDFFNGYIIGGIQMMAGFVFYTKLMQIKGKLSGYLLFGVFGCVATQMMPSGSIAEYLAYTLLLTAIGIFIYRANWKSVLLYAALTAVIMELSFGIANSFSGILHLRMSPLHQNAAAVISLFLGMLAFLLAVFCYLAVYRFFLHCETAEKQYLPTILIPILMIFFMDEYIGSILYGNMVVRNAGGGAIFVNYYQMLVIQLFGLASLFCILFAYKKLLQNFRLHTELSLLEQEEQSLSRYVEEARARYEKTKSFRHDIKNHITVVKDLLRNGKLEEALAYIGDLADMTEALSFPCSTGSPAADILLGNKLGIAAGMGIEAECSLLLPYPCAIRDIDFGIILSNALDNAIHACQDLSEDMEKYIRVTGRMQGDFVLLEVENSFHGKGPVGCGTGLSNIKAVAEKYQGAMSVKTQGKSFLLSVLLVIPQHTESIPRQIG